MSGYEAQVARATQLIWDDLKTDREITFRWLQGFEFAESEPSALLQRRGGPCGIIAPVQGMVLRHLLFPNDDSGVSSDWRSPTNTAETLVLALVEILLQARPSDGSPMLLANLDAPPADMAKYAAHVSSAQQSVPPEEELESPIPFLEKHLTVMEADEEMAHALLLSMLNTYNGPFGVLLFVYSLVLTRGSEKVEEDQGISAESLVSTPFGHANQALVNLLLTGEAVANVWDGDRDADGLVLRGVSRRSVIGYLTLLEAHRLCVVGQHLKNPQFPIWVIGSESHFTILFSEDRRLVSEETPVERARRVFAEFDAAGNGFIEAKSLELILQRLGFDTSPQSMNSYHSALISDGIVLLPHFLSVLYPDQTGADVPKTFTVYHYNGIAKPGEQICYLRGEAKSDTPQDFGQVELMKVLWTKWDPLHITWEGGKPSIT